MEAYCGITSVAFALYSLCVQALCTCPIHYANVGHTETVGTQWLPRHAVVFL